MIARGMHLFATTTAEQAFELGKGAAFVEIEPPAKGGQIKGALPSRKRLGPICAIPPPASLCQINPQTG